MTARPPQDKPGRDKPGHEKPGHEKPGRHIYGPRTIGALLPAVTRMAYRKQGVGLGQLLLDWTAIVGPGLGTDTTPKRLSAGTLTLGCTGPMALELQHLAGPLMERINAHMGRPVVQRLRFQQMTPTRPPTSRVRPAPVPVAIDGLPDGPLRDALAALGAMVRGERA